MRDEGEYRTVLRCACCDALYAARRIEDGTIVPIGGRDECPCGESEFVEVDSETVFDGGERRTTED